MIFPFYRFEQLIIILVNCIFYFYFIFLLLQRFSSSNTSQLNGSLPIYVIQFLYIKNLYMKQSIVTLTMLRAREEPGLCVQIQVAHGLIIKIKRRHTCFSSSGNSNDLTYFQDTISVFNRKRNITDKPILTDQNISNYIIILTWFHFEVICNFYFIQHYFYLKLVFYQSFYIEKSVFEKHLLEDLILLRLLKFF